MKILSQYVAVLCLISFVLAGCASSGSIDLDAQREAILEADRAFNRMAQDSSVAEAFCHYMNEDTLMAPRRGDFVRGRDAACEFMSGAPGLILEWAPLDAIVADNGDFGFSWGTYVASVDSDDGPQEAGRGKYVSIWTLTDAGWRFVADVGNQEAPAN